MNPSDTYSSAAQSSPTDATARIGTGDNDRPGAARTPADKARRAAGKAREKAAEFASDRKEAAADRIGGYSERLRASARSTGEQDPNIAHLANRAADRLEEVADYVRDADFGRLRQDAATVAQRHPALFMGGMLVAGLVLGNLAKASVQDLHQDARDQDEGEDSAYSPGEAYADAADSSGGRDSSDGDGRSFGAGADAGEIPL